MSTRHAAKRCMNHTCQTARSFFAVVGHSLIISVEKIKAFQHAKLEYQADLLSLRVFDPVVTFYIKNALAYAISRLKT